MGESQGVCSVRETLGHFVNHFYFIKSSVAAMRPCRYYHTLSLCASGASDPPHPTLLYLIRLAMRIGL